MNVEQRNLQSVLSEIVLKKSKEERKNNYVPISTSLACAIDQYKSAFDPKRGVGMSVDRICEANKVSKHELYNHIHKKRQLGINIPPRLDKDLSISYDDKVSIANEVNENIDEAINNYGRKAVRNVKDFIRGKNKLTTILEGLEFEDAAEKSFYLAKDSNLSMKMAENIILDHYIQKNQEQLDNLYQFDAAVGQ